METLGLDRRQVHHEGPVAGYLRNLLKMQK